MPSFAFATLMHFWSQKTKLIMPLLGGSEQFPPLLSDNEQAMIKMSGEQLTCAWLLLLDMLTICRLER